MPDRVMRLLTADPPLPLKVVPLGDGTHALAVQGTGTPTAAPFALGWYAAGTLAVATGVGPWQIVDRAGTVVGVRLAAKTGPVGADLIVDIQRSTDGATWASLFSTLPRIAAGQRVGGGAAVLSVTTVAVNDLLRLNVTQVGTTTAGADLTAQLRLTEA